MNVTTKMAIQYALTQTNLKEDLLVLKDKIESAANRYLIQQNGRIPTRVRFKNISIKESVVIFAPFNEMVPYVFMVTLESNKCFVLYEDEVNKLME